MRQDQDRVHDSRRFRLERVFAGRRHRAALVELTRGLAAAAERDVPTTVEQVRPRFVEPRVGSDTWRQWEEVALEVGHIGRLYLRIPYMAVYPSLATCRKQTAIIRKQDCYIQYILSCAQENSYSYEHDRTHSREHTNAHLQTKIEWLRACNSRHTCFTSCTLTQLCLFHVIIRMICLALIVLQM